MSPRNSPPPPSRATPPPTNPAPPAPAPPSGGIGGFLTQVGDFGKSFAGTVKDTAVGIAKGGYALATDGQAREAAWEATKQLGRDAKDYATNPSKAIRDGRNAAIGLKRDWQQAQAQGKTGELLGRWSANVGMAVVPGGAAVKGAKALGRLGTAGKAARAAGTRTASKVRCPKSGKMVPRVHPSAKDPRIRRNLPEFSRDPTTGKLVRNYDPVTGHIRWPERDGFAGPRTPRMAEPGEVFERWGGEQGSFFTKPGTPFDKLAVPYDPSKMPLTRYEVLKPFPIEEGTIAPAFGSGGGGTQMKSAAKSAAKIAQLRKQGYIRRVYR